MRPLSRDEQFQIQNLLHDCKLRFQAQSFENKDEIRRAADERRKALKQIDDWEGLLEVAGPSPIAPAVDAQIASEEVLTPDEQREAIALIVDLQCAVQDFCGAANGNQDPAIQATLSKLDEFMSVPRARGIRFL